MNLSDRDTAMTDAARPQAVILDDGTYIAVARDRRDTIDVIPGRPGPEFDAADAPVARLFPLGNTSQFQTGFRWTVEDAEMCHVASHFFPRAGLTGERTVVRIAVAGTPRVTVEAIEPGDTDSRTLVAETDSSGFAPHTAVISARVDQPIALAIEAALAGSTGRIVVTYHARVSPGIVLHHSLVTRAARLGVIYTKQDNQISVTARADLAQLAQRTRF